MSPPIFEVECLNCGAHYDELLKSRDDATTEPCRQCLHTGTIQLMLTAHGGYSIKGNNGSSQRPASAGSFKRTK